MDAWRDMRIAWWRENFHKCGLTDSERDAMLSEQISGGVLGLVKHGEDWIADALIRAGILLNLWALWIVGRSLW